MAELRELTIERADVTDRDVVLLIDEVQAEYVRRYGTPDEAPLHPEEFRSPAGVFLLARLDGEPAAMGGWRGRRAGTGEGLADGDAEIKRMFVRPQAQRRGIARAVLAELEATAVAAGRTRMVLETGTEQPEAISLYTGAGYVPITKYGHYAHEEHSRAFGKVLDQT